MKHLFQCVAVAAFLAGSCAMSAETANPAAKDVPVVQHSTLAPAKSSEPSLDELGFSQAETTADPALQAKLEKRAHMLKVHQIMGLLTAIPLVSEYLVGGNTADRIGNGSKNTALHVGLGITTVVMYATTASFAIFAPKIEGVKNTGSTNLHRYLAWVHGSLMVITPILGAIANDRVQHGKDPGSIGDIHSIAATSLLISYGAAMSIMVLNF